MTRSSSLCRAFSIIQNTLQCTAVCYEKIIFYRILKEKTIVQYTRHIDETQKESHFTNNINTKAIEIKCSL